MATRRENAETLRDRLGVTINTETSKPLAATLQDWADRSEAEPAAVTREVLTFQLEEALDVELTDQPIPAGRLAELLAQAQQDPQAARDALRADPGHRRNGLQAQSEQQEQEPDLPAPATLTVRLSDAVPTVAGTYSDRDQPPGQRLIGRTPVTVLDTPGIRAGLRVGTLVRHHGD